MDAIYGEFPPLLIICYDTYSIDAELTLNQHVKQTELASNSSGMYLASIVLLLFVFLQEWD